MKIPNYITKRNSGIYHFRFAVPSSLRCYFNNKAEIHKSLNTREPRKARIIAASYLDAVQNILEKTQGGRLMNKKQVLASLGIDGDPTELIKIGDVTVDRPDLSPQEEAQLAKEIAQSVGATSQAAPVAQQAPKQMYASQWGKKLSEVYLRYKNIKGKAWSEKTRLTYDNYYNVLFSLACDMPIRTIDRERASEIMEMLTSYPAHATKKPEFKGLTSREIYVKNLKLKEPYPAIDARTVNEYLGRFSTLMDFATVHGECENNPFKLMRVAEKPREEGKRRAFEESELKSIFHSEFYTEKKYDKPWKYWLPILGIYTGARLNELCGLAIDDIIIHEGIECIRFDFRKRDGHRLKNRASIRLIPIHPEIKRLGFLQFVDSLKKKGEWRVFPDLTMFRGSYIKKPSKWFADFRKSVNITDSDAVFHSFRHTVQVALQLAKVSAELRSAFLGHSMASGAAADGGAGITITQYGIKYPPKLLSDEVLPHLIFNIEVEPYEPV